MWAKRSATGETLFVVQLKTFPGTLMTGDLSVGVAGST